MPRIYGDDDDGDGDGATGASRDAVATLLPPPQAADSVPAPPDTVRALDETGDFDGDEEIASPSLGGLPNLGDVARDGTKTDQTGVMIDRSLRQGERPTLTVLTGVSAGRAFSLDTLPVTIGRATGVEVPISDAGVSRKHARVVSPSPGHFILEDLGSTNGVRVNGVRFKRRDLHWGDRIQLGPEVVLQFEYLDDAEEHLTRQLYAAATRDALTLALNRGAFDERLAAEFSYARRHETRLSVIMFDVDHFKKINDTHGHVAGDTLLNQIARTVHETLRNEDILGRYGGEEFAVIVRGETCMQTTLCAERLRVAVAAMTAPWPTGVLRATISLGVAELSECHGLAGPKDLVALADKRLYSAKQSGRDRVASK